MGYVQDSFLTFLRLFVVYSDEFDLAISGESLADSVHSFRQWLVDPVDPIPSTSQGGDSVIH